MGALVVATLALAGCDYVFRLDHIDIDAAPIDAIPPPPQSWQRVAAGANHSCGIHVDGTLWCWGKNASGALGLGPAVEDREHLVPAQIGSDASWQSVVLNANTTCAINAAHALFCWGDNRNGHLGDGTKAERLEPVVVAGEWASVSVGEAHTCAISTSGALSCWGASLDGRLGNGSIENVDVTAPVAIAAGTTWKQVAAGTVATCGIQTDDSLWCWGKNDAGVLGMGTVAAAVATPEKVGTATWRTLAMHSRSVCAIRTDNNLYCWGANFFGQLGDQSQTERYEPTLVRPDGDTAADWVTVALGDSHACAVHATGTLACWGNNDRGQVLAPLAQPVRAVATAVGSERAWLTDGLGLGTRHTCAIDREHQLWCTGAVWSGALGTGDGNPHAPVEVGAFTQPSAGEGVTCAHPDGGTALVCWGKNFNRDLGGVTTDDRQAPGEAIPSLAWMMQDSGDHTCGIDAMQKLWCWGQNDRGQLGLGVDGPQSGPQQVSGKWTRVSASRGHTCAIATSRKLYCWGRNAELQTGSPSTTDVLAPSEVPSAMDWTSVGTGIDFTCGLAANGKASCWGHPGTSQLGRTGQVAATAAPVEITSSGTYDQLFAGARHACAIKTLDHTAHCWGWNVRGQLGDGSLTDRALRIELPLTWSKLSLGELHTCGITSTGALYCWGSNEFGQLGTGRARDEVEPTQVGNALDWSDVSAGSYHTCATRGDPATLYCWGSQEWGAVGNDAAWSPELKQVTR